MFSQKRDIIKLFSPFFSPKLSTKYLKLKHFEVLNCITYRRIVTAYFVTVREGIVDVRHTSAPRNANEYVIVRTGAICVIQCYHICPRIPALPSILAKTSCNQELLPPISFSTLSPDRTIHLFCLKYSFALSHLTNR